MFRNQHGDSNNSHIHVYLWEEGEACVLKTVGPDPTVRMIQESYDKSLNRASTHDLIPFFFLYLFEAAVLPTGKMDSPTRNL